MALKRQQQIARQLAGKGIKSDLIAEILQVSHRSVQRWLTENRGEPTDITDHPVIADSGTIPIDPVKEQSESIQQKAIEMFENGLKPDAIAKELGIASRTIQRWLSSSNSPEETQKLISTLPSKLQPAFLSTANNTPPWVIDTERALSEHQECHREIRRKLVRILHNQLDVVEPNFRSVHIVSQALIRHTIAERDALNVEWLDINRAMLLIRAYGMAVVDLAQLETLKQQRTQNLSQ